VLLKPFNANELGRVTPCAPSAESSGGSPLISEEDGAHGVKRPQVAPDSFCRGNNLIEQMRGIDYLTCLDL
jgi:hypothetical protein